MLIRARKYGDKPYHLHIICLGVSRDIFSLFGNGMVRIGKIREFSLDNDIRSSFGLVVGHKQNPDVFLVEE